MPSPVVFDYAEWLAAINARPTPIALPKPEPVGLVKGVMLPHPLVKA